VNTSLSKTLKKKDLKPIERDTPRFRKIKKYGWLTKLPIFKQIYLKKTLPDGYAKQAGQVLPINLQVGDYESEVIPLKLIDHFIDKAGTIVIVQCPCRAGCGCQNHDIDLGCIWMGKGAANLDFDNLPQKVKGRFATKEEAKAHARAALKDGLVPAIGKLRGDAAVYNVLDYEDELMNFCFCCSCCCITAAMKYINDDWKNYIKRMKGVSMHLDPEKCVGCGACFKVCIYDGLKMVKGKATHTDNCIACGRCEEVCPNDAISTVFDENTDIDEVVDEIIERYEKIVDISG
jgi:formate hydrogenlyase subunit 6/NADH:ubiquinone oxidoreductase subunit I